MHRGGPTVHRRRTAEERSCRRKATSSITIGTLRIFCRAEFITNDSDTFTDHHYLLQTGMELNLNMSSGGIGNRAEVSLPLSSLDTHGLANETIVSAASCGGRSARLAMLRLRCGEWTLPAASSSSPTLGTRSSQDAASAPNNKDAGILSPGL